MSRCLPINLLLLFSAASAAQEEPTAEMLDIEASDLIGRLDLDVPDSPAFAVLGIAPQNVINPDTPAELASALILGDDGNGNGQEGLSLEFRPYLMALGDDITVGDYYHNQWLSRAAVSFVESNGTDNEDKTDRRAIGLSFTPVDERDPLTTKKLVSCIDPIDTGLQARSAQLQDIPDALRLQVRDAIVERTQAQINNDATAEAAAQTKIDALTEKVNEYRDGKRKDALEELLDVCLKQHQDRTRNATQWQLGVAYHESEVDSIDESGGAFWTSYATSLWGGSLIAHARFSEDLVIADTNDAGGYSVKDETLVGLRFRRGDDRRAVLVEASYVDESDAAGMLDDSYSTALVGAEFRILGEVWIQIAVGETFGSNRDNKLALSGQFRWAISKMRFWGDGADK